MRNRRRESDEAGLSMSTSRRGGFFCIGVFTCNLKLLRVGVEPQVMHLFFEFRRFCWLASANSVPSSSLERMGGCRGCRGHRDRQISSVHLCWLLVGVITLQAITGCVCVLYVGLWGVVTVLVGAKVVRGVLAVVRVVSEGSVC